MDIELKENERIDDLEYKDLKIIQDKNGFCFGIDSVILSDFAKNLKPKSTVVDIGTGTGIISILLSAKSKAEKILRSRNSSWCCGYGKKEYSIKSFRRENWNNK